MIIKCEDGTPIEKLKVNSRKKIIFLCDKCGKEYTRIYKNYINNDINLCRSCISKEINRRPEVKKINSEKQKLRWETTDTTEIGKKISESQKKSWANGRKGKDKKYSYKEVYKSFNDEGYTLLTTEYEYNKFNPTLKYECPNNHIGYTDIGHWFSRQQRCGKCSKTAPLTYNFIKSSLEEQQYQLLEFKNSKENIIYLCPKGHKGDILWEHWKRGHRCATCANNEKITIDKIINSLSIEFYKYIEGDIDNSRSFFTVKCPKDHMYKTCWNYWNNGSRCPQCNNESTSSKGEKELSDFIESLNIDILRNDRTLLDNRLELDIYIPSKNLAIEYCGIYWHSEIHKDKDYHLNKLNMCISKGIDLITIFEDEWLYKKDIVKHRLSYILNIDKNTIYARKCKVKTINNKEMRQFCDKYHIQGSSSAKIKLGLFYGDELVSIMSFAKQSLSKGNKNFDNNVWELSRFCSKYTVVGGAGKLLSHFKKHYEWDKIISFADRRWSIGNLYNTLGFSFVGYTKKNYWYINRKTRKKIREHRFKYRKDKIGHLGEGTEWDIMQSLGYTRIWDCGNMKFELVNDGGINGNK